MKEFIISLIIAITLIVIGVLNTRGNISTLHSYHRKRVSEENRLPFGRLVGLGTIIVGGAVMICGVLSLIAFCNNSQTLTIIGTVFLIVGITVGLGIILYAMVKYNKGIF